MRASDISGVDERFGAPRTRGLVIAGVVASLGGIAVELAVYGTDIQ